MNTTDSEPTPPNLAEFGLTDSSLKSGKHFKDRLGNWFFVLLVTGGAIGALIGMYWWFWLDKSHLDMSGPAIKFYIPLVAFGFLGSVIGAPVFVKLLPFAITLMLGKSLLLVRIGIYEQALYEYKVALSHYESDIKFREDEARKEKRKTADLERLRTNWERQIYTKLSEDDRVTQNGVLRIKGRKFLQIIDDRQFEDALASILRFQGWAARTTGRGADGGIDVEGNMGSRILCLQAKHWRSGNRVGRTVLDELMGVSLRRGATDVILASSSGFVSGLSQETKGDFPYRLQLWDGKKIECLIDSLDTNTYENMVDPMKASIIRRLV